MGAPLGEGILSVFRAALGTECLFCVSFQGPQPITVGDGTVADVAGSVLHEALSTVTSPWARTQRDLAKSRAGLCSPGLQHNDLFPSAQSNLPEVQNLPITQRLSVQILTSLGDTAHSNQTRRPATK